MIEAIVNLTLLLSVVVFGILWIHALINWDGERNCDNDCDRCPFPQNDCNTDRKL